MFNAINFILFRANTTLAFLFPKSLNYTAPWEKDEMNNINIVREYIINEIK
jgi:hypothetical protein